MAKRHPEEDATRVAAARRCVAMFREDLTPGQWAECVAGRDDPDSFCDSNMTVDAAVAEFWPWQNRRANFARMNAVVRLASRLMVGEAVSDADARAEVHRDDRRGLGIVGGGRNLRGVVATFTDWIDPR